MDAPSTRAHFNRVTVTGDDMAPDFFKPLEYLYKEAKRRYPKMETENSQDDAREWLRKYMERQQQSNTHYKFSSE